jgi:hypothetical protein
VSTSADKLDIDKIGAVRSLLSSSQRPQMETFAYALGVLALWFLSRPYFGIVHDSIIYIGRALADLHPSTIGTQLSYVYDGQSGLSLFTPVCARLVRYFGPNTAAILLTVTGLVLWIGAAALLFSRTLPPRLFLAGLLCLCVMPSTYGGNAVFNWAEPFATPRIFAEAALLAAIAAYIHGHTIATCCLLAAGVLLHPIMAAPVAVLFILDLGLRDRRWALLAFIAVISFFAAAVIHLPFAARLFAYPDPAWLEVMGRQVSVSNWWSPDWALIVCQIGTVLLVWVLRRDALCRLTVEAGIVSLIGVVLTAALPTVLILQVQSWRALWLVSVLAVAQFPAVARALWSCGYRGRIALAALLVAWSGYYSLEIAAPCIAISIALATIKVDRWFPWWLATGLCMLAGISIIGETAFSYYIVSTVRQFDPDGPKSFSPTLVGYGISMPIVGGFAIAIANGWSLPRRNRTAIVCGSVALVVIAAVVFWDRRSDSERAMDTGAGSASLISQIKYGDVFWTNLAKNDKSWLWTDRPGWWSEQQMAGDIFDRRLAIEWRKRLYTLVSAGFEKWPIRDFDAFKTLEHRIPLLDHHALNTLCTKGGPDWIVHPRGRVAPGVMADASASWSAPAESYIWDATEKKRVAIRDYLIFECRTIETQRTTMLRHAS